MSARPHIVAQVRKEADGGESPNRFIPIVSVEIRAAWPPLATDAEIWAALDETITKARELIVLRRHDTTLKVAT